MKNWTRCSAGGSRDSGLNRQLRSRAKRRTDARPSDALHLTRRGITKETAELFGVGLFFRQRNAGRIVIPIHNTRGAVVGYAGRSIDGSEPKYKFPAGLHKSIELFNLYRSSNEKAVILVEGFFDCMKVHQSGYPAVALMGSSMSDV
jgi:hypothetical protein